MGLNTLGLGDRQEFMMIITTEFPTISIFILTTYIPNPMVINPMEIHQMIMVL